MPDADIQNRLQRAMLGPCACTELRRIARKLTSLYDAAMVPAGITITQYSLLASIGRAGQLSHTVLADKLGMDRTTLTRNLRSLIESQWVEVRSGQDRRQHLLQLTAAGKRKLKSSLPLWEKIQRRFVTEFGAEPLEELRTLARRAEAAVEGAGKAGSVK